MAETRQPDPEPEPAPEPEPGRPPAPAAEGVSPAFTQIVGRALTDPSFRSRLFEDRQAALEGFTLAPTDIEALDSLPRQQLEEEAVKFERGSAVATTVGVSVKGTF
jgi:hypothetical protein